MFCPYFLVAFIATTLYWNTDTFLCVVAWIIALNSLSDSDSDEKKKRERKKKMDEEVKYRKQSTWTPPVIDDEDDESWQGKPIEIPPR